MQDEIQPEKSPKNMFVLLPRVKIKIKIKIFKFDSLS